MGVIIKEFIGLPNIMERQIPAACHIYYKSTGTLDGGLDKRRTNCSLNSLQGIGSLTHTHDSITVLTALKYGCNICKIHINNACGLNHFHNAADGLTQYIIHHAEGLTNRLLFKLRQALNIIIFYLNQGIHMLTQELYAIPCYFHFTAALMGKWQGYHTHCKDAHIVGDLGHYRCRTGTNTFTHASSNEY